MNPAGQIALVTGGAVRLGRAIALALAEAGADIALHYNTSEAEAKQTAADIEALGRRVALVQGDLNDAVATAERVVSQTAEALGVPKILVNSASIFEPPTLLETDEATYDRHLSINLKAPFFLMQQFAKHVPTGEAASIVNLIDWRAELPTGTHTAYTVAKSGLLGLTKSAAKELAPTIQVNAVAPGPVLPPVGRDANYLREVAKRVPLGRPGSPKAVSDAVLFLVRSDFCTGEMVHVTGGQELGTARDEN